MIFRVFWFLRNKIKLPYQFCIFPETPNWEFRPRLPPQTCGVMVLCHPNTCSCFSSQLFVKLKRPPDLITLSWGQPVLQEDLGPEDGGIGAGIL